MKVSTRRASSRISSPGLRIAALARVLLAHHEVAEARDLDLLAARERLLDHLEDLLDQLGGLLLREADLLVDVFDDLGLGHVRPPPVGAGSAKLAAEAVGQHPHDALHGRGVTSASVSVRSGRWKTSRNARLTRPRARRAPRSDRRRATRLEMRARRSCGSLEHVPGRGAAVERAPRGRGAPAGSARPRGSAGRRAARRSERVEVELEERARHVDLESAPPSRGGARRARRRGSSADASSPLAPGWRKGSPLPAPEARRVAELGEELLGDALRARRRRGDVAAAPRGEPARASVQSAAACRASCGSSPRARAAKTRPTSKSAQRARPGARGSARDAAAATARGSVRSSDSSCCDRVHEPHRAARRGSSAARRSASSVGRRATNGKVMQLDEARRRAGASRAASRERPRRRLPRRRAPRPPGSVGSIRS